jgi:hypothetical protein
MGAKINKLKEVTANEKRKQPNNSAATTTATTTKRRDEGRMKPSGMCV